ncbi:MAG: 2-oxo acid dehydrogenase subunit E2 [Chloroflexi bacterium]|nr:2-oxo acid dehydrogenase subunit E2 [Chloroflexota bacterium]
MAIKILMPQLGESVSEGVVGRWLKQVGDHVERDEPLVEIMTDKVNAEIPAIAAGVLKAISVHEGETVPVGTEIALLEEAGGSASDTPPPAADDEDEGPPGGFFSGGIDDDQPPAKDAAAKPANGHGVRTSPLVRRLVQEHGIDLSTIQGSGLNGRVTKDDVLAHIGQTIAPAAAAPTPVAPPAKSEMATVAALPVPGETIRVSPLRRMIAEHMSRSKATVPHATTFMEIDMTALVRRRAEVREDFRQREGVDLTYVPFVIAAAVDALQRFPTMNAEWAGETIALKKDVNVGVAVALEDGLVVPVIHSADQYSIAGLAKKLRELGDKARAGKLALEDVRGGTFTVNNPGAFGTVLSVPIINAPQAGILTMDAIVKRPVVVEGDAIAVRSMMNLGLAFDHRVNDGLAAGRFLAAVRDFLQQRAATLV